MKALAGHAADALARSGLLTLVERAEHRTDRVRIIAYHRVDHPEAEPDLDPGLVSATPALFRAQMEAIARSYSTVSLDDLVRAHRGEASLPERAVLLTFDDGYRDFAQHAWPTLKALGLPAVLFVPTLFPDQAGPGFWWDRLHSALTRTERTTIEVDGLGRFALEHPVDRRVAHKALRTHAKTLPHANAMRWIDGLIAELADVPNVHRVLGWSELRALAAEGLAICAHGHLHALCTRLSPEQLRQDLSLAKTSIEKELGAAAPPPVIAYPASACDDAVVETARDVGFVLGFGGERGIERLPLDAPLHLLRLPVHGYSASLFRAQLRPSVTNLGRVLLDGRDALRQRNRIARESAKG